MSLDTREIEDHYRRRLLTGEVNVSTSIGPALIAHDTTELLVVDHLWGGHPMTSLWDDVGTRLEYREVFAARTWWWAERALRLIEAFGSDGQRATIRVDFASRPTRDGSALYQTDWYLDLFVSGDGQRFVIDDEDELAEAVARDLVTRENADEARQQCAFLVRHVEDGSLLEWLVSQCRPAFALARLPAEPHRWKYS